MTRGPGEGNQPLTRVYLQEKNRQKHFINLIPSENFTSQAVLDALGSVMQSMSSLSPVLNLYSSTG